MTTAQIIQSVWAGLATAAALALFGLYLNKRRAVKRAHRAVKEFAEQLTATIRKNARLGWELGEMQAQHTVLRQEFERKLDRIVELEHELDRVTPLKRP